MVCVQVFTLASHMSDFFGPGLLESALAPSAGLCERILLLIWMPPSSSSACSFCPEISPLPAPWGSGECRTSVQKRVRGPWSSQKWQRATIAFIARAQHIRQGLLQMSDKIYIYIYLKYIYISKYLLVTITAVRTTPGPAGCQSWSMSSQELLSQSVHTIPPRGVLISQALTGQAQSTTITQHLDTSDFAGMGPGRTNASVLSHP